MSSVLSGLSFYNLSYSYVQVGDLHRAMESAREAMRIFQTALPPSHPYVSAAQQRVRVILEGIQESSFAADDSSAHASAAHRMRDAGGVIITRHRGGGCAAADYSLQFRNFNTFTADVRLCGGCFYWEVEVVDIVGVVQFGVCTDGFEAREDAGGEGVGDDAWSWAADGTRLQKWHDGPSEGCFGSEWAVGDIIGFALDMRTAGAAVMSVSVNGSFAAPNGVAFSDINAVFLSPAFSGDGRYRVNFGDRPFAHAPPDGEYTSVHDFHRQRQ